MEVLFVVIGALLAGLVILIAFFVRDAVTGGEKVPLSGNGEGAQKRNTRVLWVLILVAIAYSGLFPFLHTLTGSSVIAGIIGVGLGLYVCAHPAANAVHLLFFERGSLRQTSEWSVAGWLVLNLAVLLAGWVVVFAGLRQLVAGTA